MALPIIEKIAVDIETAINAITTDNGFQQDLTALRPKTITYKNEPPTDRQVVIKQLPRIPLENASLVITWQQIFEFTCWVINSEDSDASYETRANQFAADIEKKLKEDVERNGNAYNTTLLGADNFESDEGTGVIVTVAVDYKVKANDPYTKG